jgi:hypothetical protein
MTPDQHRAKAQRIERSLRRLAPSDHELTIEAAMLAGTHWLNAVLHEDGVTAPDADVMHTYMLVVNELRRLRLVRDGLIDALTGIEDIRPGWVRGNLAGGEEAAARALAWLARLREAAGGPA